MTVQDNSTQRAAIKSWRHDGGHSRRAFTTAFGVTLTAAAGLTAPAHAQDEPRPTVLSPITVEGVADEDRLNVPESSDSRFTAPLLDTPKSVTVVPAEVIEQRGDVTLADVFRATPGISLGSGEGGTPNGDRPLIRGFNAENSIMVDGIRDPGAQSRGVFNLEQVEVVKGADSVYSGRGGAGGSINLVTKTAKRADFNRVTGAIGTDSKFGGTLDSNVVLTDTIAARFNLTRLDRDIPGRDAVDESIFGGAATISFGMDTKLRATLSYSHYEEDSMPDYGIPWVAGTGDLADVSFDNFYGLTNRDFSESKNDTVTARFEYDLASNLTVSNTTRFAQSSLNYIVSNPDDSRGNVANGYLWRSPKSRGSESESWANVLELAGKGSTYGLRHSYAVGVEISHEDSSNYGYAVDSGSSDCSAATVGAASNYNCTVLDNPNPNDPWTGSVVRSTDGSDGTVDTVSLYAFDTVKFSERWQASGGVRYDNFSVERTSIGGRSGDYSGENDSEFVTFQAGLVYKPARNGAIYASVGTAAEPAGVSNGEGGDNLSTDVEDLEPVMTTSFEIGAKWDVLGDRLSLGAALFQNSTDNARVTIDDVTRNVGEERVRGVEFTVAGRITERWSVFGGYTRLDPVLVDDGDGEDDGNVFPNTPKDSFSLWTTFDVSDRLTVGGGGIYRSSQFGDSANTREIPSYFTFDIMAEFKVTETASIRMAVNNLTDERYVDRSYSTHYAHVAAGRSFTLTGALEF